MRRLVLRTVLGAVVGYIVYSIVLVEGSHDFKQLLLMIAWGIGIGNAFSFNLSLLEGAFRWATSLSILSFFSFGSGIFGIVALIFMLGVVLSLGWIYGWYILIRDIVLEMH